jgi:hypothetical protein
MNHHSHMTAHRRSPYSQSNEYRHEHSGMLLHLSEKLFSCCTPFFLSGPKPSRTGIRLLEPKTKMVTELFSSCF